MREIKFRVWSQEDKEYRTDCRLADLFTCKTGTPATVYSEEGNRFDIEQYTELKDRNGKEIYEGDIITVCSDYLTLDAPVIWHGCGWKIKRPQGYETLAIYHPSEIIIIGNIHENPELIEGKNG